MREPSHEYILTMRYFWHWRRWTLSLHVGFPWVRLRAR